MLYNILNTKVFICGSIHMLPKDAAALPSYINNILEVSDNCVFESNSDNFTEPNFFRYPNNETLEQHVPISLLNALACLCKNTGIAYKLLLPLKIWRVSQLLSQLLNAKNDGNLPK
ncbi:MAG: TraB/GumN family protein [Verrucomicrobiia bacterium]